MANGHVEIHDPFSNNGHLGSTDCDPEPTSDGMTGTPEFRIVMAYAKRRRPNTEVESHLPVGVVDTNGTAPSQTPVQTEKEKRKKKKGWRRILRCVNPRTKDSDPEQPDEEQPDVNFRCIGKVKEDEMGTVVSRLTEIADEVPFTPPEIEPDSEEGDLEKMIGLLLREDGDRLDESVLKNVNIAKELFWNYSFFKRLITALFTRMGLRSPDTPGPHTKTQIAVTCEVTSRLSSVNTLAMSRMLDHGARYLQEYYSAWAQQQGGYEAAFDHDEDEVQ